MTLPAQDIVERLRSSASRLDYAGDGLGYYTRADAIREREAAATISRLTADNEALRKQVGVKHDECNRYVNEMIDAKARADALAQALRAIVDTLDAEEMGEGPAASEWSKHWQKLHDDARAALGDRP